jgi:hypothetical protein
MTPGMARMAVQDEMAGIRWRRGLLCRLPRLWLDVPRPGALAVLTDADVPVPPRARVLATPQAANLAGLTAGRALQVPYGQPFQLGAGVVELLPSGASLGGAIARLHAKGQTILAVRSASLEPLPSCPPLQLREADILLLDAGLADAHAQTPTQLRAQLHADMAEPARVWLLQTPLTALDLLLWADGALRVAPSILRLVQRSGLPVLAPQTAGRQPQGVLLWPLHQMARLPAAWLDAPRTVVADPDTLLPPDVTHVPFSRRLTGDALVELARQAACPSVLAWGHGAESLAARLAAAGQMCDVLRIPYQLPLV